MKRLFLLVLQVMVHGALFAHEPIIIPTPQSVATGDGYYRISPETTISASYDELQPLVDFCVAEIGLTKSAKLGDIKLIVDDNLEREEYRLSVSADGVTICGGGYGGLFNGVATFMQLLPADVYSEGLRGSANVVCCEIADSPRYEHRGFMLDVCRTWMDKEAVMNFIDLLAYHKINSLRLHLTDDEAWRLEIKSHPELAEVGGFRGGESPIWPRYGKWNEKWGGYYTQEDMREIIAYAAVRNIEVIPEIDLPGHSLCMATMHPEILCDYTRTNSASYGYDTRSAFCASREENYELLADILGEVCELFPSEYIHIGGDEVEMSQWERCPSCQALMRDNGMSSTSELQQYFMSRLTDILAQHGKKAAVWNEAIDGGKLSADTRVYGWESIKACRSAAANYQTVVMPGQFFYFDMKQSPREPGHDWAAIFDWTKVYDFSLTQQDFTLDEQSNIIGFEGSFFSEAYASHNPETADYLHYQTFPRIVALSEIAWVDSDERDEAAFYKRMIAHYDRLDAMGVAYRLMPPKVEYKDGRLMVSTDDGSKIFYRREPMDIEMVYTKPIETDKPAEYSFITRRGEAHSPEAGTSGHFKTITPSFNITSSMNDSEKFSFDKAEGYGRIARTTRAGDVGDWVMFTFDHPVSCRRMKVATGNFQLPRFTFENGYVEVSHDGTTFERVGELECGMFYIEYPARPIKAVRITCTSRGNGAAWVSIQPPTIWPTL
jgi:hexosaminidase